MIHRSLIAFVLLPVLFGAESLDAGDSEYALQPLAYNHPGLTVDLGVGLWAYPMPIDYDQDGDMDLLVGCPDKPTQGTFYFENPTQDPSVPFPVFKPAVRVADGHHYMSLSKVDGQAVVVRPGLVCRRDRDTGKFAFDSPEKIAAPKRPDAQRRLRVRGNFWRYVDHDGDGDQDLVVGQGDWSDLGWDHAFDSQGRWRNGPLHGHLYLLTNEGSDQAPVYPSSGTRLRAGGGDIDVYGWPCHNFADFDGDGDLDLLTGDFLDRFTYFANVGTRKSPQYASGVLLDNVQGDRLVMNLQMITPTVVDWDGDGDHDLVVGDEDGRVALVRNTGELRNQIPVFESPVYFRQEADTLKFGALATPHVVDWDGDGDQDILCGNSAGEIGWFENLGPTPSGLPRWNAPELLTTQSQEGGERPFRVMAGPSGSIQGPCEAKWGYTTLSTGDWDHDGDQDIIYNSILARIGLLINDRGNLVETAFDTGLQEYPPRWYWWQTPRSDALTQWRTTPLTVDWDKDGKPDLISLDQEGFLTLRRQGGPAQRIFFDDQGNPIQLNSGTCGRSGRYKLAAVDWDGDSRLDLLVNSENATWYRNVADHPTDGAEDGVILKKVGNLAKRNVAGHTSSPAVADFDNDGQPDLIVGCENGRLYHIAHDQCVTFDESQTHPVPHSTSDDSAFPGWVADEFVFDKAPFAACHASSIVETSRGLVAAWFAGPREGDPATSIYTSYHDGLKWNAPLRVAKGIQFEGSRYPCWNPVLFQPPGDAPTLLFFKVGPKPSQWWGEMMVSYDRGRTFTDRRRLPEGILGPIRSKPLLLDDGHTLLCGSSTENDGWKLHFESVPLVNGIPNDQWQRGETIRSQSLDSIQPTLIQPTGGRLQLLCRTKNGVIATSASSDNGHSWTTLKPTALPNPNSAIDAITMRDGRHALVYNDVPESAGKTSGGKTSGGRRGILRIAISDDGKSWADVATLEQSKGAEFSYPAIIQSNDGHLHVTYTHRRERIKHVVIDPSVW